MPTPLRAGRRYHGGGSWGGVLSASLGCEELLQCIREARKRREVLRHEVNLSPRVSLEWRGGEWRGNGGDSGWASTARHGGDSHLEPQSPRVLGLRARPRPGLRGKQPSSCSLDTSHTSRFAASVARGSGRSVAARNYSFPNSGNWFRSTRHSTAEMFNARPHGSK